MGIKMSKKPNWSKYLKRLRNVNKELLLQSDEWIVGIIKRTQSGKEVKNNAFRKYHPSYKKPGGTSIVNLTLKGTMLHALTPKKIKNGVRLHFPNTTENKKAFINQERYKRKFLGLDKKQIKTLKKDLKKYLTKKK